MRDTLQEKNATVSAGNTRVAKHLRITPTMVDDFLIDPVMGVYILFGIKLDVFQEYALRIMWWVPNVLDSSGFGTGKSFRVWLVTNLRALLIPEQQIVVYYQDYQSLKDIYWSYYSRFGPDRAPLFVAQKGRFDEEGKDSKDNTRGGSCHKQFYKNEACIFGPAPNWLQGARGQAGRTFHVGVIDEWTKAEAMTPKNTRLTGESGNLIGGIDQQIIGRIRAPSFNQYHMLWGNHIMFTATAESTQHPGYARYQQFEKEIAAGNPHYAIIHSCFKDFSNVRTESDIRMEKGHLVSKPGKPFREQVPNWNAIRMLRGRSKAHFQREALGIWARDTQGFYAEDALGPKGRCITAGMVNGTEPQIARGNSEEHHFLGIDPAAAQRNRSDDGALVDFRLRPKPGLGRQPTSVFGDWLGEFVWAYRVRGQIKTSPDDDVFFAQRAGDWSGLIHTKHQHFNFDGIMMDSQGGGLHIWPELNKARQRIGLVQPVEREVIPIATPTEGIGNAHYILMLFLREYLDTLWPALAPGVDSLYTAAHLAFQDAVAHGDILFPKPFNERPGGETANWPPEKKWALKNLDQMRRQLTEVQVVTKENGQWDLTRNGSLRFSSLRKKDLAYAGLFAFVRALIWLKMGELDFARDSEEEPGCYTA